MTIERVGIVGAGIMGRGISEISATHGFSVTILDANSHALAEGLRGIRASLEKGRDRGRISAEDCEAATRRISGTEDMADLWEADLVIEAVPEKMALKRALFADLGRACRRGAILASNTSSLSLSEIASAAGRTDRTLGLHFFNPPTIIPLVEVIATADTSPETVDEALDFCNALDRVTVRSQDAPGFVANRLLVPFIFDAIRLMESGVASAAEIDLACRKGLSHAMGPLATADLIGLDTLADIGESIFAELGDSRFKPPTTLTRLVSLGRLGRKTGSGLLCSAGDNARAKTPELARV